MTLKVKFFLTFLAVMAIVSVFSFFDVFTGVRSAKLHDPVVPLLPLSKDADQDGLSDKDESYWNTDFQNPDTDGDGFIDGEEVISGFDPREPSDHPLGDSLKDTVYGSVEPVETGDFDNINFTENVSELIFGGLGAGDIGRETSGDKESSAFSILIDSTIDDFYKSLPLIPLDSLNTAPTSEKSQLEYLEHLAEIIKENLIDFPQKLDFSSNPFEQNEFFISKSEKFRLSRDKALALTVPENWRETHEKILDLLNRFHVIYNAVGRYDEDAIKAIIAFNDIEALYPLTKTVLEEVQEKIKANNLQPDDVVLKVMGSIY